MNRRLGTLLCGLLLGVMWSPPAAAAKTASGAGVDDQFLTVNGLPARVDFDGAGSERHSGSAALAAPTAAATSSAPEATTFPSTAPLAGFRLSWVRPLAAACHVPPIKLRIRSMSMSISV